MGRLAPGVVVVPRAPVSRWTRLYEDFVGFDRLKRLQNQIREVENECLRSQNVRFECQQRLIALQGKLKDLHSKLQETSTTDKRYSTLFADELRVLTAVRAVTYDFHLYEEMEKEQFLQLEGIFAENRSEQLRASRRSDQFLLYACLVGLAVGILGTITSFYLHSYFLADPARAGRSRSFRQLAVELASAIESKNVIVRTFLQDLAVILGSSYGVFLPHGSLVLPSADDESEGATSLLLQLGALFVKYNAENEDEMNRLRSLLVRSHPVEPTVQIAVKELSDDKTKPDLGTLWRTTFVYSVLIVAVPLAYSLLA